MFIVLLRLSDNRGRVGEFLESHKAWLRRGFDEGVFVLSGGIQPNLGGAILAQNASLPELQARVEEDPFVREKVVSAEILELSISIVDERLEFLHG